MRAFQLSSGEVWQLSLGEAPVPRPAADEVLIRLHAAGLNYLDLMVARGRLGDTTPPFIPGTDGAGEIVEMGERVRGWAIGDRVISGSIVDWSAGLPTEASTRRIRGVTMPGSLAEHAVVPAGALVRIPDGMPYTQAVTLPIAATTAWNAIAKSHTGPASTVALLGTGGVSLFALQFAKAAGARVILSSSSNEKLERARQLGADVLLNYTTRPAWDEAVLEATDGQGADLVVETVGGATFARSINAAKIGGTVYVVGFIGGMEVSMPVLPVMVKTLNILGSQTGSTSDLARAVQAVRQGRIEPVIDRVFPFEAAAEAYAYLASGAHFGKVVMSID
ncbi:zinc-dependent alcohol dehydrogenase family protein [Burkholderia gladioli]|jgi:NADPH:quinone reductase-like Zn-dependent oxidoreductase|uniref:NAD(P)-dependent alcohol dehydrogenase n=3 Tax=Burkholderia gladioli TaxID=28095 RepID=A0AB38TZ04_BURGA|nr:NAD(P)-dependent alcohol dehydrogenase [Burkholderia gladioli]KAF1059830.1 alcohol dehydrogenase [Burkholderia gladioli]MBA1361727.1 NAD(P)-dependent alcohol dehydrogenase [Burkholderia gladioli]MBJ9678362.1 NAD(P)-dependent alcohol dehydrogenase [Burkholderia gladioli]MBU9174475.1 NAD(P)-dependent alcohol dehydrogenase [Burkholderia gladioli]MBU9186841.1 NAD(P)-dependent alcohol dehydrogenase [Burkholderia gladioli]